MTEIKRDKQAEKSYSDLRRRAEMDEAFYNSPTPDPPGKPETRWERIWRWIMDRIV